MVYLGMDFYSHIQYKVFESDVLKAIKGNYNILINCILAADAEFFIKKFLDKHKKDKIGYITHNTEDTKSFNFLNLDLNRTESLGHIDSYISKSGVKERFAVVVNNVGILNTESFAKSVLSKRYYTSIYIKNMDFDRAKILASDSSIKLNDSIIREILVKTGGIAILTKYFVLNSDNLGLGYDELIKDNVFKNMLWFICEQIAACSQNHLEEFGIKANGKFTGEIIQEYFERNKFVANFDLSINKDGYFNEFGTLNENLFLKVERNLVLKSIENKGMVTKEEISDIKWGKDSYDEYSDQAIKKTIQRINKKLSKHIFIAIPTIGYKLVAK